MYASVEKGQGAVPLTNNEALRDYSPRLQRGLIIKKNFAKAVHEKSDAEEKNTKKMYDTVLETENTFAKEMEHLVDHKEMADLRKREILHKKWNDNVHEPIKEQIVGTVSGPCYGEMARRKRILHKQYLEHINKKGHVFLDTIAPDEYYPLSLHPVRPSMLTAQTRQLRDPLLAQERQRCEDTRIVFRCMTGSLLSNRDIQQIRLPPLPLVPLGRHGTECSTWLEMPMGDIESPVRMASRRRMGSEYNNSHFRFDNWGRPTSASLVDQEMQIQKRRPFVPGAIEKTKKPHSSVPICAV